MPKEAKKIVIVTLPTEKMMKCLTVILLVTVFSYHISQGQDDQVLFGFDSSKYSVKESAGSLRVTVTIQNGTVPEGESVTLLFDTRSGTAKAGEDFMEVIDQQLVFDENQTSQAVNIGIVMDDIDENDEVFYVILNDPMQENSTDIFKRATVMIGVGGIAKVTIVSSGNEPVDIGLQYGLGFGIPLLFVCIGVGVAIAIITAVCKK